MVAVGPSAALSWARACARLTDRVKEWQKVQLLLGHGGREGGREGGGGGSGGPPVAATTSTSTGSMRCRDIMLLCIKYFIPYFPIGKRGNSCSAGASEFPLRASFKACRAAEPRRHCLPLGQAVL